MNKNKKNPCGKIYVSGKARIEEEGNANFSDSACIKKEAHLGNSTKDELEYRLSFEKIITTLSTNFIKLSINETDEAINRALGVIGEFAGFDRSYIFLFYNDGGHMENTHEWCAEGIKPQIKELKGLSTSKFPWWIKKIKKLEPIYIPRVTDLPIEAAAEKEEFERENIKSLVVVPMVYENSLIGFLGFDSVRSEKACKEDIITLLTIVGEIFVNALERRRAEKALQKSEDKLNAMLLSIGDYIWMIDKNLKIIWANDITKEKFGTDIIGKKCHEVYRKKKLPCYKSNCLAMEAFRDCKIHEQENKLLKNGKDKLYFHCTANVALRDENGEPTSVIIIARDITACKKTEEELLQARNELEQRIKERTADLIQVNKELKQQIIIREQVEMALRQSEERFRSQYKCMPMPTYTWQKIKEDFILIDYNDAGLKITDGKIVNYLGIKAAELYYDNPGIIEDLERCFTQKNSFNKEMLYHFKCTDKTGYFATTYAFVPPDLVLVHTEDISDRKRSEEELKIKDKGIASSINAFFIADLEGNLTYINHSFLKLWGYENPKDVLGKSLIEFLHEGNKALDVLDRLRNNLSVAGEFIARRKDGSSFDVYLSANLITDDNGRPLCIMSSFINITQRKRAETKLAGMYSQLEKNHDDMLSILNMLRMGTAITDKDGCIIFLSQTARRMIGMEQYEALGRHWEDLFPITEKEKTQLIEMSKRPPELKGKVSVHIESREKKHYWLDIEVQDDPRNPERKILFFYDVSEIYDLRRMLDEKAQFHDLIGKSESMKAIYQQIKEISKVDWTVLIEGETGTGKELVARSIHFSSYRKDKPFVPVNCAGLTDSLLSSQLFGHKRGAFTGAIQDHKGFFETANEGTIFLDEIGDISINVQTNLLRVLEEKEITRLGESSSRKIDVRVIAATNKNLIKGIEKGTFRPDLFYRIRVTRIKIPTLRKRREDIPLLVDAFLGQCRAATGKPVQGISNEAMNMLLEYNWPGNVRELKSAIELAVTHCKKSIIHLEDIPPEIYESASFKSPYKDTQQDEKELILTALKNARGNCTLASRSLGISRATLYRRLATFGIKSIHKKSLSL